MDGDERCGEESVDVNGSVIVQRTIERARLCQSVASRMCLGVDGDSANFSVVSWSERHFSSSPYQQLLVLPILT